MQRISERVGRCLERLGLLVRHAESAWLDMEPPADDDAMTHLLGSSVTYRIAVGPHPGRKAFMLRTLAPLESPDSTRERVAKVAGFSLHAGVSCEAHQLEKRERLCRYIARPPVSVQRLSLSSHGKVVYLRNEAGFLRSVPFLEPAYIESEIYRLSVSRPEVIAGQDSYTLQVEGASDTDVQVRYRLDDSVTQEFVTHLSGSGEVSFDVGSETPKGLYHFVGFRLAGETVWVVADETIRVTE